MKKFIVYFLMFSMPLVFFSCYPGGVEYYSDTDIVYTNYDETYDFSADVNYFMPDTIFHAIGEDDDDDISREYDEEILTRVANNMASYGYTRVFDENGADVFLTVTVTTSEYTGVGWIPGGGWGGYYPGWGWGGYYPGYPWYPGGYPIYYSYTTGSIFVEMIPPDLVDPEEETITIVWQGIGNGLLSSSAANTQSRIDRMLDQMFTQSTYLDKN